MLPRALQWKTLKSPHDFSHLGRDAWISLGEKVVFGIGLSQTILEVTTVCNICYYNKSRLWHRPFSDYPRGYNRLQYMLL